MPAIEEQIRMIVQEVLRIPPEDIGESLCRETDSRWDSMGHLNLIIALEQSFGIQLGTECITKIINWDSLCSAVTRSLDQP